MIGAAVLMIGAGATAADSHRMEGSGNASCGNWTEARASAPGGGMTQEHPLQAQWVLGFLTGVGMFGRTFDPLKKVEAQGVVAWMDNYCRSIASPRRSRTSSCNNPTDRVPGVAQTPDRTPATAIADTSRNQPPSPPIIIRRRQPGRAFMLDNGRSTPWA